MDKTIRARIDKALYKRGIQASTVRHLLGTQILLTLAGLACGIPLIFFTWYPLLFGIGSALATYNFWHIIFFVQGVMGTGYSKAAIIRLFAGFTSRLFITGGILFSLIIWLHMPVLPLVVGLTSTVAGVLYWAVTKLPGKPAKEA